MEKRLELLVTCYDIDDLLDQNDIDPKLVIRWLIDEGYIDLEDYFISEDSDEMYD